MGRYGRAMAGAADQDTLNIKNNQSPLDLPRYKYKYRYMYRVVYCLTLSHAVAQKRGGGYIYIYIYIYICMYVCMYIYIYIYIHSGRTMARIVLLDKWRVHWTSKL